MYESIYERFDDAWHSFQTKIRFFCLESPKPVFSFRLLSRFIWELYVAENSHFVILSHVNKGKFY